MWGRGLKYKNKITTINGETFHSKGEALRYQELKLQEGAGAISDLKRQVKHDLICNEVKVGTYTSDYEYNENGSYVIEDFKGKATDLFKLKWAIMKTMYQEGIKQGEVIFRISRGKSWSRSRKS